MSWKTKWNGRTQHYKRPSDVKPREERRPSLSEISQQKFVLQKVNGWKVHHLTAQMEDLAELEKTVCTIHLFKNFRVIRKKFYGFC